MNKLIRIHDKDNVLVVREGIEAGESIEVEGVVVRFREALALGHKVAACAIAKGDHIIKFGVPIGSATCDIPAGAHVHLHNMKSNYLPTYAVDEYIKI